MSGVCTDNATVLQERISFCSDVVPYRACIPAQQPLWESWTVTHKDALLAKMFKKMVDTRMVKEMNVTPDVYIEVKFLSNPECISALKNALCWYNFPKCSVDNQSLPLCTSSCEHYYRACRYKPDAGESFLSCQPERTMEVGLFNSNSSGPAQALAPANNGTACEGIEYRHFDINGDDGPWYQTSWGIAIIVVSVILLLYFMYYFIVPLEAQDQISETMKWTVFHPLRLWRRLPKSSGRTVIMSMTFAVFVLFIAGLYMAVRPGGGLGRFGSYHSKMEQDPFRPPASAWSIDATRSLTQMQLKQLHESCTCTGGAVHRLHLGILQVIVIALAMLP